MKNLSDLKKYLATDGATLTLTNREVKEEGVWRSTGVAPRIAMPRKVAKLQTTSVALSADGSLSEASWLEFGKAAEWTFLDKLAILETDFIRMTYATN